MDNKEKIVEILRNNGPSIPTLVSRKMGMDSILISSMLSELIAAGKVKITKVKFGSSSFYYLPEHIARLEPLSKHLNEKDRCAYNLIKDKKVVKESEMTPLERVSAQNIKDFAFAIRINYKGDVQVFWRHFLVSQEEAIPIIKKRYFPSQEKEEAKKEIKKEIVKEISKESKKVVEKKVEKPKEIEKEVKKEIPKEEEKRVLEPKKVKEEKLVPSKKEEAPESVESEKQTILTKEIPDDEFVNKIKKKFDSLNIQINIVDVVRKNSEVDMSVEVPTPVGRMNFYVKAKSKKKINDGDLSSAYIGGQTRNLPVLFVTEGKLTKKAESMIGKEFKNNFTLMSL